MASGNPGGDRKIVENAAAVLGAFFSVEDKITQIDLMKLLPLRRTSIFYAFELLEKAGLISKAGERTGAGRGLPRTLWELNPGAGEFLVAYLSQASIFFAAYDFKGALVSSKTVPATGRISDALASLAARVKEFKGRNLCGVIVVLAGIIDASRGEVFSSKVWSLRNYPLRQEIVERLPAWASPLVVVENRARMAAWGERVVGCCRGVDNFLVLYIEEGARDGRKELCGVGSGVVIDGHPFRGGHGVAGELDHSFYHWYLKTQGLVEPVSFETLTKGQTRGFGAHMGEGIAHIVNYLSVEKVVVSFEGMPPSEDFASSFRRKLLDSLLLSPSIPFPVEVSKLGEAAALSGSADMIRRAYFNSGSQELGRLLASRMRG